jgi:hypothetical protein
MMRIKKMVLVALALILCVGIVSAAVLDYYGRIIATVNVAQAVVLDGKTYPDLDIPETVSGTAGSTLYGDYHWLRNDAGIWILVELTSTSGAAYPEYKLVPTAGGAVGVGDEDDIHFYFTPMTWSSFSSVSFDYNIVSGPSTRVPHVNMWLRSGDNKVQITTWNGGSPNPTLSDGRATYEKAKFVKLDGTTIVGYEGWEVREVRIQSGNPSIDPSLPEDLQVVYVSNVKVNDVLRTWIELPTQGYANIPGRYVEFRMAYYFAPNVVPGSVVIDTTVEYKGTISESGVTLGA